MEFLKDYFGIIVTVGGWCMTVGLYVSKIRQHDVEIKELKGKQSNTDSILQNINNSLSSLNTKMDLVINDKIKKPSDN